MTRKVGLWPNQSDKEIKLRSEAAKALAETQLASVELTELLIENECKRLGPDELACEMDNTWVM